MGMESTKDGSLSTTTDRRLPDHWVSKLFADLQGHYGSRFLDMWRTGQRMQDGTDVGLLNAKNTWAEKLGGFRDQPDRIKRALANLPPHPPTLPEFAALCRQQTAEQFAALPAPYPNRTEMGRRVQELADAKTTGRKQEPRDCMDHWRRIRAKHEAGEAVPELALRYAREALRIVA